ncbi:hypothetical protein TNCV_1380001 [Trichonephila clavipes]|nr:hypothetical protein TNCV_1380001 [Trichonephila clavipes]
MGWPSSMYRPTPTTIHLYYSFSEKTAVSQAGLCDLRQGRLKVRTNWARAQDLGRNGALSRSRLSHNEIIIRIISTVKCVISGCILQKHRISDVSIGQMGWPSSMYRPTPTTIHLYYSFSEKTAVSQAGLCDLRQGRLKVRTNWARAQDLGRNGALSRSRLSHNEIIIRIISTVKCVISGCILQKNTEFRMYQLARWDGHRPCTGLRLPPFTFITHSVKRQQSVKPVCAIEQQQILLKFVLMPVEKEKLKL